MITRYAQYVDTGTQWLDGIPEGWQMGRLNEVARAWTSNVDKHSVEGQLPVRLCNYTDVYKNDSILGDMDFMSATATPEQVVRFRLRRGDTIITKDSETADDIGIPTYVEYEAEDLICGYHLAMIRPDHRVVDSRFLYWQMTSKSVLDQWEVLAAGVTRVGIRSTDLAKVAIVKPPLNEQRTIADFLDREVSKIDALVAEQVGLVQVLRERRTAVIESAILSAAPMTKGQRFKHVVVKVTQGWSPQCYAWPADGVENWGVLKAGAANGGQFRPTENKELPPTEPPRPDVAVRRGQLIVSRANTRELVGSAAVVEDDYPRLMLCDKLYAFDLDPARALPHYVSLTLGTRRWRDLIELEASGSSPSMQNISQADIANLPMDLPTVNEQQRLLAELREQTDKIDALIVEAEGIVAVAKERRSALIAAAVTGQIDVRGEVA